MNPARVTNAGARTFPMLKGCYKMGTGARGRIVVLGPSLDGMRELAQCESWSIAQTLIDQLKELDCKHGRLVLP